MHGDPSGLELRGRLGYISVKGQTVLLDKVDDDCMDTCPYRCHTMY
jgi:hypothetical protein